MNKYYASMNRNFTLRRMFSTLYNYTDPKNPKVFLEVSRDGKPLGKMVFEVKSAILYLKSEQMNPQQLKS
jgi:hypothetical protein